MRKPKSKPFKNLHSNCMLKSRNLALLFNFILSLVFLNGLNAQSRPVDGWVDFGSSHVNKWLQFASGTMGPNALPVPEVDYALIGNRNKVEIGAHFHQMKGDTAINSFLRFSWNVVPSKVVVELWGNPTETFRMTNEVRDKRQVYWDDTGWITHAGDLWISTKIQLLKGQKALPDLVLNYTTKTTTGLVDHARYTDAPLHYFYLAAGKSFFTSSPSALELRVSGQAGFYVWQTNMVEVSQDEGPMSGVGIQLKKGAFSLFNEWAGYWGYDAYSINGETGRNNNDPLIMRLRLELDKKAIWRLEYQYGFRNYPYQTFRLSGTIRF